MREVTKDFDLPENVPMFLFVGRMMWYKGLKIILDALKLLREQDRISHGLCRKRRRPRG